ncbi:MAG TPA: helix-turn-helix domain-containing protein [Pseudonocardiaceae bacterium]|nr:helix-turn-helix domain-containing protein [Pseudonocardiaceae bacterium]
MSDEVVSGEPSPYEVDLGGRIAQARQAAALTQAELADHLNLTRSSVANIEAGRQAILAERVVQIGEATGTDARWLLTGDAYAPPLRPRLLSAKQAAQVGRAITALQAVARDLDVSLEPTGEDHTATDRETGGHDG